MLKHLALSIVLVGSLGCSESRGDDGAGGDAASGPGATSGAGGAGGATSTSAAMVTTGAGGAPSGDLVVNEINVADDWIELHNRGTTTFDLSGILLADEDTPGVPKLDEAISFPAGTTLSAGGYLFVLAKQTTAAAGEAQPQTVCAPGSSPCFHAPFGLSGSGDAVYVLDGDTPIATAVYPDSAVLDTQSYCRLPNGAGAFEACTPTPGAENQ